MLCVQCAIPSHCFLIRVAILELLPPIFYGCTLCDLESCVVGPLSHASFRVCECRPAAILGLCSSPLPCSTRFLKRREVIQFVASAGSDER